MSFANLNDEPYNELLLGCGHNRKKKIVVDGLPLEWQCLFTVDKVRACKPDLLWNLEDVPLPFSDDTFNEIHAYEVLEHIGRQGDWEFFFNQWNDFYRIMRPGGLFFGTCPSLQSRWVWGDPGHTRAITPECFIFLDQLAYAQIGRTPMSDYRFILKADFERQAIEERGDNFLFVLKAHKPMRKL